MSGDGRPRALPAGAEAACAGASAFKIDPWNRKGTVTLAGKKEERQVPCLEYWYELEVKDQPAG